MKNIMCGLENSYNSSKKINKTQKAAIKMAIEFLEELSDVFSTDGCNDFSIENTEENWQMYQRAIYTNNDLHEVKELEENGRPAKATIFTSNNLMVYACKLYLKDLLKEEV